MTYSLQALLNTFFPSHCVGCGQAGMVWCGHCALLAPDPWSSTYISTPFRYQTPAIRSAIHYLKKHHHVPLATWFAQHLVMVWHEWLIEQWYFAPSVGEKIIITYIPPHKNKTYCCARLLAEQFSRSLSYPCLVKNTLVFTRQTTKQAKLGRTQRAKNLHGALQVKTDILNHMVIVVDDITTTGATLHEARRALLAAGAKQVWCLAIAHTDKL